VQGTRRLTSERSPMRGWRGRMLYSRVPRAGTTIATAASQISNTIVRRRRQAQR
jgi:hypothetical protein